MCYAIFAILIALTFLYSDSIVEGLGITTKVNQDDWITIAIGWEMVEVIWPLLLLAAIVGSAVTYLVPRIIGATRRRNSNEWVIKS